jgi:hypothetical protein
MLDLQSSTFSKLLKFVTTKKKTELDDRCYYFIILLLFLPMLLYFLELFICSEARLPPSTCPSTVLWIKNGIRTAGLVITISTPVSSAASSSLLGLSQIPCGKLWSLT